MPVLPSTINGIRLEFSDKVNRNVDRKMIEALHQLVRPEIAFGYTFERLYVSSTDDGGRERGASKAVEFSSIDGMEIEHYYPVNSRIRAIVDAMQLAFESYPFRRENIGPAFRKLPGERKAVTGHGEYIHLAVN